MKYSSTLRYLNTNNVTFYEDHRQQIISNNKKWIIFLLLFAFIYCFHLIIDHRTYSEKVILSSSSSPLQSQENFLDGCRYIYIDMGTNIGVQIRKLYEPHFYPNADVLPLFQKLFGTNMKEVCSVGFEANPVHDDYLKEFEQYCIKQKYRVKIFTSTAVNIVKKNVSFYTQPKDYSYNQWGSSLIENSNKTKITVSSIDIASWFKETVLKRKISFEMNSSRIMMKTDLEGYDSIILTNLIFSGLFCSIDLIYGEHFNHEFQNAISILKQYSNSCKTQLIYMDDESYFNSRIPFS